MFIEEYLSYQSTRCIVVVSLSIALPIIRFLDMASDRAARALAGPRGSGHGCIDDRFPCYPV